MKLNFMRGYRAVALVEIIICIFFFLNIDGGAYGKLFDIINAFGAGILFTASLLVYHNSKRWMLWTMVFTMFFLILFNSAWFIIYGVFVTTGFPLIAYDILFSFVTLQYLGKGL